MKIQSKTYKKIKNQSLTFHAPLLPFLEFQFMKFIFENIMYRLQLGQQNVDGFRFAILE
jgi:hypothetical protein